MEPNFNLPRPTPEQTPSLPPVSPEVAPGTKEQRSIERAPAPLEREPLPQSPQEVAVPVSDIAAPVPPQPVTDGGSGNDTTTLLSSVPDVAADDDLIEKEWVSKAKDIISQTTDDPHRREAAVSQLQREYLRKRYGKELGTSE